MAIKQMEVAEFTDAQKQVVRTRLLPALQPLTQAYYFNNMTWIQEWMLEKFSKKPGSVKPNIPRFKYGETSPLGEKLTLALMLVRDLVELLHAVADTGTPASRAGKLGRFLALQKEENRRWRIQKFPMELWVRKIIALTKDLQPAMMTDKGQALLSAVRSEDFRLLAKSWPWICQEIDRTFNEMVEKYGLVVFKDTGKNDGDWKGGKKVTPGAPRDKEFLAGVEKALPGWTQEKEIFKGYDHTGKKPEDYLRFVWFIDPDGVRAIGVSPERLDQRGGYYLIPKFRLDPKSGWYSWARLGVDDGEMSFDAGVPVQSAIEEVLEKINTARANRLATEHGGQDFNFGPFKKKLLPDAFQRIVDDLKAGKTWTQAPAGNGFGVYTIFTTNRSQISDWKWSGGYAGTASDTLTNAVGKTVYWHKEERD